MTAKKKWWQSKTAWLNILVGGVAVMFPEMLGQYLNEANMVMILSVVNIILRAITKEGIAPEIV